MVWLVYRNKWFYLLSAILHYMFQKLNIYNNNNNFYGPFSGINWVSLYVKKHLFTLQFTHTLILIINHPLSASSTTIHSILFVQFMHLTVFLHHLSPGALWSTSWSGIFYFILHIFLLTIIVFFSQHMLIPLLPFCCSTEIMWSILTLSLNSLLGNSIFALMPHILLTIFISARWSATSFS